MTGISSKLVQIQNTHVHHLLSDNILEHDRGNVKVKEQVDTVGSWSASVKDIDGGFSNPTAGKHVDPVINCSTS